MCNWVISCFAPCRRCVRELRFRAAQIIAEMGVLRLEEAMDMFFNGMHWEMKTKWKFLLVWRMERVRKWVHSNCCNANTTFSKQVRFLEFHSFHHFLHSAVPHSLWIHSIPFHSVSNKQPILNLTILPFKHPFLHASAHHIHQIHHHRLHRRRLQPRG